MGLLDDLAAILPREDILDDPKDCAYAAHDQATNVMPCKPYMVVRVNTVDELIAVVRYTLCQKIPLVMRGAGTGKSGGAIGSSSSIVIDTMRLNRIIAIDVDNLIAIVEPGVILADLQAAVEEHGLWYPCDPASSSKCTLGGNVAENAAGPSTIKYGSTKNYLLGGQAIIGTGEIIDFGKRCPKGVTGFDIASLLCGSEGTLAVFTKFFLRLVPKPSYHALGLFFFTNENVALTQVSIILTHGFLPKTIEYVDHLCLSALKHHAVFFTIPSSARAMLMIECDASCDTATLELDAIYRLIRDHVIHDERVSNTHERKDLWQLRSSLSEACARYLGYKISEDIALPLGSLSAFNDCLKRLSRDNVWCGTFGHAGDGNMHVQILFADMSLRAVAEAIRHEILLLVVEFQGTLTAEHGIGLQKKAYLPLEQSQALINLQQRIKQAFDPHGLLNPGKIFDV